MCVCLGDRDGVLVLLLVPRLVAKTDLLISQIRDKVYTIYLFGDRFCFLLNSQIICDLTVCSEIKTKQI